MQQEKIDTFPRSSVRVRVALCLAGLFAACLSSRATAQTTDRGVDLTPGKTTEVVEAAANPDERYALFLPRDYKPDRTAPVMLLMDPRGRAMIPLELFREAADRYGFVLLSSYSTLSDADSAYSVNDRALSAMLGDAQTRFKTDPRRLYLVGFSGTAHYSWTVAPRLDGKLAGILGVGGGLPSYSSPIQRALKVLYPFAYFGVAGMGDFNFDGVRYLDQSLDSTRFAHRMMTHDGDHEWPPVDIAEKALEWFHLQAMRSGLIPSEETFIEATRRRYLEEASALESSDRKADAYRRYREIVQDFDKLGGAPDAEKAFKKLAGDRSVNRELDRRAKYMKQVIEYKLDVRKFYLKYREQDAPPPLESALQTLEIAKLKKRSESKDPEEAFAAKRMLATAFVNTGFYEPRDYLNSGDYERAAGMLRIADAIYSNVPRVCFQLARAAAQIRQLDEAFEALECAHDAEWVTRDMLTSDALLEPLRGDPRFSAVLARH